MTFLNDAGVLLDDLVALRRRLHAFPEVGLHLPVTQATLLDALDGLDLEVTQGSALTSVTAVLRGGMPGPVVLLRADMDALPVTETTGLPFAAPVGAMHACGHDLHMAALVGAIRLLGQRRADLQGSVVFMFQPGEEGCGGARLMLDEGVLAAAGELPLAAYAVHVDCVRDAGQFATRPAAIAASVTGLTVRVVGTGGHAASPHLGTDPVPVAAEIVMAIQTFVARRVPATDPAIVSVGRIVSNSPAGNVLATSVEIEANIRTLSHDTLQLVRSGLEHLVTAIAGAHDCGAEVEFIDSYPVAYNDPAETTVTLDVLQRLHGAERVVQLAAPWMASEDFAYVLDEVPGVLLLLGARPADVPMERAPALHSELAVFDDSVLGVQAATLAELAWHRLALGDRDGAEEVGEPVNAGPGLVDSATGLRR